jgi:type IV pilus assembly protein PilM
MAGLNQKTVRPRLACEITSEGVIAARASDKAPRLEVFTSRRWKDGTIAPGLSLPNILDAQALRTALSGALAAVAGKSKDVIVVLPDVAIRMILLDFESLPGKREEIEPVIRFRLKKSLPFDVDQAVLSYDVTRSNGTVRVAAAVAPREVIEEYEKAFRDIGYEPGVVLPSSLAALGLVDGERPTLVLKVDPMNITITAVEHHELRLVRTLDNPHGGIFSATDLSEAVLPSIVFFEDTFAAHIEKIYVGGTAPLEELGPLLHQQTGAQVQELAPELAPEQNLSGEQVSPTTMAGIVGALLG